MPSGRDTQEMALAFDRAARQAGVRYAFMGAVAVSAWGEPRTTSDVDCLLLLDPAQDRDLVNALAGEHLKVDPKDLTDAREDRSHVSIFDEHGDQHIDLKIAQNDLEREEVEAAVELALEDGLIRVVRPEETLAFKLAYGSEQDLSDAKSILIRQAGKLDTKRLLDHASRLGVSREMEDLLRQHPVD